jgi:cytidylate kinase
MALIPNAKKVGKELGSVWRSIAATKGLTVEFSYRIDKLSLRLDSIADKIFMKTVKAHDILTECAQLTGQFKSELDQSHDMALRLLTQIEGLVDRLEKDTHEFRIKAG